MTEKAAKELAAVLTGEAVRLMPSTRTWGVVVDRADGMRAVIEDHAGSLYRDRAAFEAYQRDGDQEGIVKAAEWGVWGGGYEWASSLAGLLGSEEYWHSGGGHWLVFYRRPDGRFAVVGADSGAVYGSYEEFDADLTGEKAENHAFV